MKKIFLGIFAYVLVSAIRIARLANTLKIAHAKKVKSLVDDLVVTCNETVNTWKTSINFFNKTNYWLPCVVTVKYYMKHELTIPCFLSN